MKGYLFALVFAILTYLFYALIVNSDEKYFTIPLDVIYPPIFVPASDVISSVNVRIKGSQAALSRISSNDIEAILNLSGIDTEGQTVELVQLQQNGALARFDGVEVYIEPAQVEVVLDARITKEINVMVNFTNSLPRGYVLDDYRVIPSKIEVSGPRSILDTLTDISTDPVDLSTLIYSNIRTPQLRLPKFVEAESILDQSVQVRILVSDIIQVQTYNNRVISIQNLSDAVTVSGQLPRVSLVLQGAQLEIERFRPEVFMDVSSVQLPGLYNFNVQVTLPEKVEIISISPNPVEVLFVTAESPQEEESTSLFPPSISPESTPSPESQDEEPTERPIDVP